MKTKWLLVLSMVLAAIMGRAEIIEPGWFDTEARSLPDLIPDLDSKESPTNPPAQQGNNPSSLNVPVTPIAEAITSDIQALADGLERDPVRIYNYVHDHIRHVLYFGSKKGAQLTLLEKSGNDFDQCALLVALLRAAGYDATYQFGWMLLPYDNPDASHRDLHHWLCLDLDNTNWTNTSAYLIQLFYGKRGYPLYAVGSDSNTFAIQRTWVKMDIAGTNYYLDPSFKVSEKTTVTNLIPAMGYANAASLSNALMAAAAGTETGNYVTNLNEAALRNILTGCTSNLLNTLQSNLPNASVQDILGGWQIVPSTETTLSQDLLFTTYNWLGAMPVIDWDNEPTNIMSSLKISFAGTNYQCFIPQLQGQRLSLTFDTNGLAQLWQDDTLLTQHATSDATNVTFYINHPVGGWNTTSNSFLDGVINDQTVTNAYQRTNATYAILYAFEPDWSWLQKRQNQLDAYRQQGLSDTSRQVTSETLNIMGLNWMLQSWASWQMMGVQTGVLPEFYHRMGRMGLESGKGYYVDVYMQLSALCPGDGLSTISLNRQFRYFDLMGYFGSALESGLIEQMQSSNLVAASTVKMLQLAITNNQAVFLVSKTNWTAGHNVKGKLVNYDTATLTTLGNQVTNGYYILLPQNGSNFVAGAGSWAGYGYVAQNLNSTNQAIQMQISGNYHGGYSGLNVALNILFIALFDSGQPAYYNPTPVLTPSPVVADPVDVATCTFLVETADLSLGQSEPRGITIARYYNGTRRNSDSAGMAAGWIHNYSITANTVAAPQAGLGGTTPAQAASMLVASSAALGLYNNSQASAKNWMVTALISKWGVDQITKNGVSIHLGKDMLQFVKQPTGVFTPPANSTMTLTGTNSYTLQERHGNTFKFDSLGRLTNIVDQYSQSLKVAYNASNNWVSTLTDWKNRAVTFTYSGSPQRLTSISDGARSVSYGYSTAYSPQGDLVAVTDPESKTSTFVYDTNHQITATFNALNQLVVSNLYDNLGHITTQYTQGDLDKMWRLYWSGWENVEQDPAGNKRRFYYDDKNRLTGMRDALGNLTQTAYDGQNHVIATASPLYAITYLYYDGRHNLTDIQDPLGYWKDFYYDSNDNLYRVWDERGGNSYFGYNSKFQMTASTNNAGEWTTFAYNATDGTLTSRTDAGGTTSFGYDSYGQLNSLAYPGGLGTEGFGNNSLGDVLSRTNARGFVTSFQYSNRRELTNIIAPTNITVSVSFDAVGNAQSSRDARGFVTSNLWSATQKLLATYLPATPQGTPVVTNAYDNRDWPVRTINPLQQATLFTNDAAQRLVSVTDPVNRTTRFGYDADNRKIATTNAANEVTRQQWNERSELTQVTTPTSTTIKRSYDAVGNQITLTNRNGKVWQFQYDAANRLTNTISPLNRNSSQSYNNRGLLSLVREPSGQMTTNYYDAKGRLTNSTDGIVAKLFRYDANDNLTNLVEQASSLSWAYDAYDRASSFKDVFGNLIQYRYDQSGNLTNLIYPGGKNVFYAYDSLNRLTNVTDWSGRKTMMSYDLASHLTSIMRPNGTQRIIGYDAAGQTTNIIEKTAANNPIALFKLNWNNAARAEWEFAAPLPHAATIPTRTMTYDDDNRLLTVNGTNVLHDADGNMTNAPLVNGAMAIHTYDVRNRLLNVGGVTNAYDPAGNRVGIAQGTNTTAFVVNPNAALSQVLMRVKNGVTNYYIYGVGLLYQITETATTTNTFTYHYDYRGSTVALTDKNGNITDRIEYSAYALTTYRAGTNDTPFLFNGQYGVQTDANGLLHMRARFYNPHVCRFINVNPSGFGGGLNFYAFADGNPISMMDPFGLGAGETTLWSWLSQTFNKYADALSGFKDGEYVGMPTGGEISHAAIDNVFNSIYGGWPDEISRPMLSHFNSYDPNGVASEWADMASVVYGAGLPLGEWSAGVRGEAIVARTGTTLAEEMGLLQRAARGTGDYGLGSATGADAMRLGKAWVGEGYTVSENGIAWVSADGLRQFRPPTPKNSKFATTGVQANFERRAIPKGDWGGNGHLNIIP